MHVLYFRFFIETFLFTNVCLSCQLPALLNYTYVTTNDTFGTVNNSNSVVKLEDYMEVFVENQQIPVLCPTVFKIIAKTRLKSFHEVLREENTRVQFINCNITAIEPGRYVLKGVIGHLKISGNKLNALCYGIFNDMPVRQLDLSYNNIAIIASDVFEGNVYLEYLILKGNFLDRLDSGWFKNIANIKSINFANNCLEELKNVSFIELIDKRISINLSYNKIVNIEENLFFGMQSIDSLLLQGNNLSTLPDNFFRNASFYILHFGSNQLRELPVSFYSCDRNCNSLYINNNKFSCNTLTRIKRYANFIKNCEKFKATKVFGDNKKC